MGTIYDELKQQGYKYVAKDKIGGECAYKTKPVWFQGTLKSDDWRFIINGYVCDNYKEILSIDVAIQRANNRVCGSDRIKAKPKPKKYTNTCVICGRQFKSTGPATIYCGAKCKAVADLQNDKKQSGTLINGHYEKECPMCGKQFNTLDRRVVYCGEPCRLKARRRAARANRKRRQQEGANAK